MPAVESALDRGDGAEAISLCEAALAQDPNDACALRTFSLVLAAAGRDREALVAGQRACELAPSDPRAWSDLGRVHAITERYTEAAHCFRHAVTLDARYADGWHNLGTALKRAGLLEEAFIAFKRALLIDSTRADTYLNLGGLLIESQQLDDALECFERAARFDPSLARAQSRLAAHLASRGKLDRASTLFRRALTLDAKHIDGWFGLGQALEDLGDAEGALSCYRNLLARESSHGAALGRYLALLRADADQQLIQAATNALSDERRPDEQRALIGYGLAKYHDRLGDVRAAATAAVQANGARRRQTGAFDRGAYDMRIDSLIETYDRSFFEARRDFGLGTDQPVFIVGLPRSGTTLVEQIIASHPMLHGAGELPDLPRLAARVCADSPWTAAARIDSAQSREIARAYLNALRDGAPRDRLRITDKSPFNFYQLAFAALLFPQARVIHCRRDARDNALSIWLENFNHEQTYATDFDDLAQLRRRYEDLLRHWHRSLPLPILDVDYESLVADVEGQAKRLIDFLQAPWDRRCLDFHKSDRAVQTPSRWQVRERVYTRSVGRWRSYASHLPELTLAFT